MELKLKSKKKSLIILGSLLILSSLSILSYKYLNVYEEKQEENKAIEEFYEIQDNTKNVITKDESNSIQEEKKYDYIAVINIPKINLEKGLVNINSKYNDINYNIKILENSDMPDVENGDFILVSHSGTASISYFRNINKLNVNDVVYISYQGVTYTYKVINKYEIEKTGKAVIKTKNTETNLVLITCVHNTNKQLVIILKR